MSIAKKCLFLITTLLVLFSLSCKQKRVHKQVMAPVDLSGRTINIDWESRHKIIGSLGYLSSKNLEELDGYMAAFTNKVKYLPTDSLMPRIYPISDFSEHEVYSVSWGHAEQNKVRESIDTLKSAKGKIWRTTRWSSTIKGKVDFPERGVSFYMEIPFSYRFNPLKQQYEYFPSQQNGSSFFTSLSGPAFGELNYPETEVMNIGSEDEGDGFDGWAMGELMVNERRNWEEYADKKMKFLYGQSSLIDHNIKTTYKTSELFQVELTIRFKTPANVKNYNTGNANEYANREDLPLPIYIIIASGKFLGIHHN